MDQFSKFHFQMYCFQERQEHQTIDQRTPHIVELPDESAVAQGEASIDEGPTIQHSEVRTIFNSTDTFRM